MRPRERHVYEFGPFRIDTQERLLTRGGEVVPLTPKAIDTLLALIADRSHVVEKDELMKTVWPDTFVEEGGLARNISLLRKALGESPEESLFIETFPKRGYRFVGNVSEVSEPQAPGAVEPALVGVRRRWKSVVWVLVVLAALVVAVLVYSRFEPGPAGPVKSLAVLPLENLSKDEAEDYFAEGFTEALITDLAKISTLRVISRTSVMRYQGTRKPLEEIARELDVEAVMEGTVLESGGRVRITAKLVDVKTGKHLLSESYERDLRDILILQNELAGEITRQVRVTLTPLEAERLTRSRRVDPGAYHDYLKGRYFWNKRTEQSLRQAIEHFQAAIEKDPVYALAYSGMADCYALLGSNGIDAISPREAMPLAKAYAARAIEIDDTLAEAYTSLAYVGFSYDWDLPGAGKDFDRALELNPGYATAHHWRAHYLLAKGQLDKALKEMQRALDLDPLSLVINVGLGWCLYYSGQYDGAIEHYRKTLQMAPDFVLAHQALGMAYARNRNFEDAIAELEKAATLSGGSPSTIAMLGHTYAVADRKPEAEEQMGKLTKLSRQRYVPAVYPAVLYMGLGQDDQALEWLRMACEERSEYLVYFEVEPALEGWRKDGRFRQLLRQLGPSSE